MSYENVERFDVPHGIGAIKEPDWRDACSRIALRFIEQLDRAKAAADETDEIRADMMAQAEQHRQTEARLSEATALLCRVVGAFESTTVQISTTLGREIKAFLSGATESAR